MDQSIHQSARSSKRKTRKTNVELKEYTLPTSPSLEDFKAARREPSSNGQSVYLNSAIPAQRTVTRARPITKVASGSKEVRNASERSRVESTGRASQQKQAYSSSMALREPFVLRKAGHGQEPLPASHASVQANDADARFQAFLAKHTKAARDNNSPALQVQWSPEAENRFSLSHIRNLSTSSFGLDTLSALDSLDPDFIAEFVKANQGGLVNGETPEPAERHSQHRFVIGQTTPTNAQVSFPFRSPQYLTPEISVHTQAGRTKPPRPPRSDKRVSPVSVAATSAVTKPETHESLSSLASAFADAVEDLPSSTFSTGSKLSSSTSSSRPSAHSSTRPSNPQHRRISQTSPSNNNAFLAQSPIQPNEGEGDLSQNRTATFEDIVPDLPDPSQDDFERDRRLSSLFKGLGMQGLASAPPSPQQQALREELYRALEAENDMDQEESFQAAERSSVRDAGEDRREVGRPSFEADSYASADEGQDDDWGNGYPDSPEKIARQGPSASSSAYHTALDWCEDSTNNMEDSPLPYLAVKTRRSTRSLKRSSSSRSSLRQSKSGRQPPQQPAESFESANGPAPPSSVPQQRESRSLTDPRMSLGITDSVLASILASESFCLPSGARLSINEIAARLSVDKDALRMSVQQHLSANLSPSPTAFSSSTGSSRVSSMQYFARPPLSSSGSRTSWEAESPNTQYFDERAESYAQKQIDQSPEPQEQMPYDYADESLHHILYEGPPDQQDIVSSHMSSQQEYPQEEHNIEQSPALLFAPDSVPPTPAVQTKRGRTLSVSTFQKLSQSFSGVSTRGKTRRRLPSFFGGNKAVSTPPELSSLPMTRAPSPIPDPAPHLIPPTTGRKRAMTGPACLIDIANAVTNSPSFDQIPPPAPAPPQIIGQTHLSGKTWKSTIPEAMYAEISKIHSRMELRRQEVIFELYQTEESFVNGLKGVVRLFSQPLRTPQGTWIAGVPNTVSRLLDWLDDIVYIHCQLVTALQQCKASQGIVTLRVAETFLPFIPRLEVHQPYLIRFEAVTREIDEMGNKPDSEFGEFVRMQQGLPECGYMSLSSFLLKPVQRLMKYPLFFKQLCDLTPTGHPDHTTTHTLLADIDSMIRVMQEVKVREEEYEEMKLFSTKIAGLPTGMTLARRDRRLLANGVIKRVHLGERDRAALESCAGSASMVREEASVRMTRSAGNAAGARPGTATSTFGSRSRPVSTISSIGAESLSVGAGYPNTGWTSNTPRGSLRASPSHAFNRPESINSFGGSSAMSSDTQHSYLPTSVSMSRHRQNSVSSSYRALRTRAKETSLHVYVFNDIVVFATKQSDPLMRGGLMKGSKTSLNRYGKEEKAGKYRVVDDWGVAKVLSVTDLSGQTEHEHLLQIELLPIWTESESTLFSPAAAALATTIYLTINDVRNGGSSRQSRLQEKQYFTQAFEQSYCETMKSLIFLDDPELPVSHNESSRQYNLSRKTSRANIGGSAARRNRPCLPTDRTSCASIVDAGLPLPKSPSEQAVERIRMMQAGGGRGIEIDEEREERGWWATRLQKVRKEMGEKGKQLPSDGYDDSLDIIRLAEMRKRKVVEIARSGMNRKRPAMLPIGMAISCDDEYTEQEDGEETEDCAEYAEMAQASIQHARVAFRRPR